MLPYLLVFSLSVFLLYIAHKIEGKSNILYFVLVFFAITICSLLAGMRDYTVGTDVLVYGYDVFRISAFSSSFGACLDLSKVEFFYSLVNYLFGNIVCNFSFILFTIQFLILIMIFAYIYRYRAIVPIWFSFLVYLFLYYNVSLNLIRQSIAISFLYAFLFLLENRKYLLYIFVVILSYFFHRTAVLAALIMFVIYYIGNRNNNIKMVCSYVIGLFVLWLFFSFFISVFVSVSGFERYMAYVEGFKSGISVKDVLINLGYIGLFIFFMSKGILNRRDGTIYVMFILTAIMCEMLGAYTQYAPRFGLYFSTILVIAVPANILSKKITTQTQFVWVVVFVLCLLFYWYLTFNYMEQHHTIPYKSDILKI